MKVALFVRTEEVLAEPALSVVIVAVVVVVNTTKAVAGVLAELLLDLNKRKSSKPLRNP